jgi:hypothetical protein
VYPSQEGTRAGRGVDRSPIEHRPGSGFALFESRGTVNLAGEISSLTDPATEALLTVVRDRELAMEPA